MIVLLEPANKQFWTPELEAFIKSADVACQVHLGLTYHRPKPLRLVVHHILPIGMGGPNLPSNWVIVCDTGHYNIHRLLGVMLRRDLAGGNPALLRSDGGSGLETAYAQQGYSAWISAGRPGKPVFEVQPAA